MKWIFYALVVVNIGYAAFQWRTAEPPATSVAAPPTPDMVNRLLLLSEVDRKELRERAALEDLVSEPAPIASAQPTTVAFTEDRICYSVGPLNSDEEIATMRLWLTERGGAATLRNDERRELALYWVYFPPLGSAQAASERINQMRREGVDDIYIIHRGDMANAISLGVYSRRSSLERRLGQLRARGYSPSIVPRYRTTMASWFDVEFGPDFQFDSPEFIEQFPAIEMSPANCPADPITPDPVVTVNREAATATPAAPADPIATPAAPPAQSATASRKATAPASTRAATPARKAEPEARTAAASESTLAPPAAPQPDVATATRSAPTLDDPTQPPDPPADNPESPQTIAAPQPAPPAFVPPPIRRRYQYSDDIAAPQNPTRPASTSTPNVVKPDAADLFQPPAPAQTPTSGPRIEFLPDPDNIEPAPAATDSSDGSDRATRGN